MRLLIIILFSLISIGFCYASFPKEYISNTLDTVQNQEIMEYHYHLKEIGLDIKSCKCVSCQAGLAPLFSKSKEILVQQDPSHTKNISLSGNSFAILSVVSAVSSLFFAFLTLVSGLSRDSTQLQINIFFLLSISSFIGVFLLGNKARKKGVRWGKVILGSAIAVLGLGLFFLLFIN